ncbi:hypothetical protein KIN20_007676 [Parelaphostrongylus tenuis]|uniref:Uncharacterized protein n=1 Tax=Parelaphostrongylus tenuis TaxID=148309 RepID=A0AAD5QK57_PARTN|nr:hypothetical protein KIN20_007676 [Parelaphostrongylus tenuis]
MTNSDVVTVSKCKSYSGCVTIQYWKILAVENFEAERNRNCAAAGASDETARYNSSDMIVPLQSCSAPKRMMGTISTLSSRTSLERSLSHDRLALIVNCLYWKYAYSITATCEQKNDVEVNLVEER